MSSICSFNTIYINIEYVFLRVTFEWPLQAAFHDEFTYFEKRFSFDEDSH